MQWQKVHSISHVRQSTKTESETYSLSQKILPLSPEVFLNFSPNGWEYSTKILHAYCAFISMANDQILFNSLNLTKVCRIKCNHLFTTLTSSQRMNGHQIHQTSTHLTIMWRVQVNASGISHTLLKTQDHSGAKNCTAADLGWLAADNDQQSY